MSHLKKKLENRLRETVSKEKIRFENGGYNLDLTYITDKIIAMGYPACNFEGIYRNRINDVQRFLEEKHPDKYRVYNLCDERLYDKSHFHGRVAHYPFVDHNPPPIPLIKRFCVDVHDWLNNDPDNIVAIHCKAGKGRTGVMICCYLLYSFQQLSADLSLAFYAEKRTQDGKGVTIPSQQRYVHYIDFIQNGLPRERRAYHEIVLLLRGIKLSHRPVTNTSKFSPQISVAKSSMVQSVDRDIKLTTTPLFSSGTHIEVKAKMEEPLCLEFKEKVPVSGDIKIKLSHKFMKKVCLFQFWFNTFCVERGFHHGDRDPLPDLVPYPHPREPPSHLRVTTPTSSGISEVWMANSFTFNTQSCVSLRLDKSDLDKANGDLSHQIFPADFQVVCFFEKAPEMDAIDTSRLSVFPIAGSDDSDSDDSMLEEVCPAPRTYRETHV